MNKKVVVISASPRRKGNSDLLCEEFIRGAQSAGHEAEKIFLSDHNIKYCTGCGSCVNTAKCILQDDMKELIEKLIQADVIVFATPVYFYNMNGQLKTFIDRLCPRYSELSGKTFYIIMSAAEDNIEIMNHVLESFEGFFDCLDEVHKAGVIYGLGVYQKNEIINNPALLEAYESGKQV